MVYFDYNDGNYSIDFDTGQIIVYDFDNACFCWYIFDLDAVWTNGIGWIQFEPDTKKLSWKLSSASLRKCGIAAKRWNVTGDCLIALNVWRKAYRLWGFSMKFILMISPLSA